MSSTIASAIWLPGKIAIGVYAVYCAGSFILGMHPRWYYMSGVAIHFFALLFSAWVIPVLLLTHRRRKLKADSADPPTTSGWLAVTALLALTIGLHATAIPLRFGFVLGAKGALEESIQKDNSGKFQELAADIKTPLYAFSASGTNRRLSNKTNAGRILFMLNNDSESAFIYAPQGIEGLAYNSGNCGHLMGDWYWMKED